jgi:DNA-binding CsgD family transcriptional regulator
MRNFLALLCFFSPVYLSSQTVSVSGWLQLAGSHGKDQSHQLAEAIRVLNTADSNTKMAYYLELGKTVNSSKPQLAAHALLLKPLAAARLKMNLPLAERVSSFEKALNIALRSDDPYLLADCLQYLGDLYFDHRQNEKALLYLLKAYELKESLGPAHFAGYKSSMLNLGSAFYNAQEYDSCISLTKRSLDWPGQFENSNRLLSAMNSIAICFQRKGQYDSAARWYQTAYDAAIREGNLAWQGITKGNIGYLYMLRGQNQEALPYLWSDYYTSLEQKDTSNAGNTLQRIARILDQSGKKDSARQLAFLAYRYSLNQQVYTNPNHRMNAAETLADVLMHQGDNTAAIGFLQLFHHWKDSLQAISAASRLDRIQLKIDYEKSVSNIQLLKKQNQSEKQRRQLLLAAIILLLLAGTLFILWTRQKNRLQTEKLIQGKKLAESQAEAAQAQLESFTNHIIEKNELIETLQRRLTDQNQQVTEELLNQTILTDEDWKRFKDMFEKVYPGFFRQLQILAPEITAAETRMASVIRLGLGNKYIASMLGVSGDTVRKAKFRLKQRLQLKEDSNLEEFIVALQ